MINFLFFLGGFNGLVGFVDFMYKSFLLVCFFGLMKFIFDLNDG